MTIEAPLADDFQPTYRSGTAARLAGIPVETLRVWERRYRVVGPRVTPRGHRLYSADDVARLASIKDLVDLGSPIGSVANLPLHALRTMRSSAAAASHATSTGAVGWLRPVRVALIGNVLAERVARDGAMLSTLEIVATCSGVDEAADALRGVSADVLAIELPALLPGAVATVDAWVQAVGARHAIVEYRFAPVALIESLRHRGHDVVRAPLGTHELERLCRIAIAPDVLQGPAGSPSLPLEAVPQRRFDDQALSRLARASTTLYCECPRHLVDLLIGLGSFERYSSECANRNPADAVLHRYLQRVAGSARALFEEALVRLARAEGIALPVETGEATVAV